MTKEEAKKRIEKLKREINYHRYLYHVLDRQEISDDALDSLKHELYELEMKYPEFITPDSPTQRIGGKPLDKFEKVKHIVPQWSFNDAFEEKEILDFDKRLKKELGVEKLDYTSELKIDGMHVILTYKKGFFEGKNKIFLINSVRFFLKNYLRKNKKRKILYMEDINFEIPEKREKNDINRIETKIDKLGLTEREKYVLSLLYEGYTLREIGEKLNISHVAVLKIKKKIRNKVTKNGSKLL